MAHLPSFRSKVVKEGIPDVEQFLAWSRKGVDSSKEYNSCA